MGRVIGRIGRGGGEEAAALLQKAAGLLDASSLGEDFPAVRFEVPPTMVVAEPPSDEEIASTANDLSSPLRLSRGNREAFLAGGEGGIGADRLSAAARALFEEDAAGGGRAPVVVQQVTGSAHGPWFYPHLSGVLYCVNHYPVSYMKPGEGIVYVRLGLGWGRRASLDALRFSPAHPDLMPDFSTPPDILRNSQRKFFALPAAGGEPSALDLEIAYRDGTLAPVGGVYSRENGMVYPGVRRAGVRLVTFAPMLRGGAFPLASVAEALHDLLCSAFHGPVAVDFSVQLGSRGDEERHLLAVERVRPTGTAGKEDALDLRDLAGKGSDWICSSTSTLGDGVFPGIRDILCVTPARFDRSRSHEIAGEIGEFNAKLAGEGRRYVLIGSGRWGTTDQWLGIPVTWEQVSGAQVQVEAGLEDFNVDPSRGTHFFRELTYYGVGTMHVTLAERGDSIDWAWLESVPAEEEGRFVRHLSFGEPLRIRIDGRRGRGAIEKPLR